MSQRGYHGTGVVGILKSLGIPKGSFYNFFESKEAFLLEAIELYGNAGLKLLQQIDAIPHLNPIEKAKAFFDHLIQLNIEKAYKYSCFLGNLSTETAGQSILVSKAIQSKMQEIKDFLSNWITQAKAQQLIKLALSPDQIADMLYNNYHGALVCMKYEQSARPLKAFITINFELLLGLPSPPQISEND